MADETGADQEGAEPAATIAPAVDIEARATRMGWRPKDQYKGPEGDWIPADQFVERVNEQVPLLRRTLKTMEERTERTERALLELNSTFNSYREFATKAEQRAYDKALKDLLAQRDVAIQQADVAAVRSVDTQIKELDDTAKPAASAPKPQVTTTETRAARPVPEIEQWIDENTWYRTVKSLMRMAQAIDADLMESRPGLPVKERLAAVREEVRKRFPEKFSNPLREAPASVGSSNGSTARRKQGRGYDDLPQEARKACDKIVAQFKNHKKPFTREEYVANYAWSE